MNSRGGSNLRKVINIQGGSNLRTTGISQNRTRGLSGTGISTLAKKEAKQANAKIVKIVDHRNPDALNSCHRIKANLYRYDQIEVAADLTLNSGYSLIHFYRAFKYPSGGTKSRIHNHRGDLVVALKNNSAFSFGIDSFSFSVYFLVALLIIIKYLL